jgi:hypothetical protein
MDIWGSESPLAHFGRGTLLREGKAIDDDYIMLCNEQLFVDA